jgi:hypothetical protein
MYQNGKEYDTEHFLTNWTTITFTITTQLVGGTRIYVTNIRTAGWSDRCYDVLLTT